MDTAASPQPTKLGPYEIRGEVGRGGMAVVYQGIQPSLNRTVAIKVLPGQFAERPELLARFEREGTIVAQLNHPNLVQVIDRGQDGDTLYIVMEYVDGGGLDTRLAGGPLPLRDVLDWAAQICDALDYAHGVGVVHRDLKPSNILIEMRTRRPKITDFGIAQLETDTAGLATLTLDNTSIGTMNYMSPEQRLDAHRVDHRTDIFSFGVILYQMLTGKLPLGHFKLPSFLRSDVPIGLDSIVNKCLAESPDDRYQNASDIRDDLLRLSGHAAGGDSQGGSGRGRLQLSGRQRIAVVAACLALLAGLAVVVVPRMRGRGDSGKTLETAGVPPGTPAPTVPAAAPAVVVPAPVEPVAAPAPVPSAVAETEKSVSAPLPAAPPVVEAPVPVTKEPERVVAPAPPPPAAPPVAEAAAALAREPEDVVAPAPPPPVAPPVAEAPTPVASEPEKVPALALPAPVAPAPEAAPVPAIVAAASVARAPVEETRHEADFARARGLIGSGKYEAAVPVLEAIIAQSPEDALAPEAQFSLAGVCRDMGDRARAVSEYEKLVRVYPASARVPEALLGKVRTEWDMAGADFGKAPPVLGRVLRAVKKAAITKTYPATLQQRLVTELQAIKARYAGTPHALAALRLVVTVCTPPEMGNDRLAAETLVELSKQDPEAGPEPLYDAARIYDRKLAEPRLAFDLYEQLQSRFPENSHAAVVRERLAALRVDPP